MYSYNSFNNVNSITCFTSFNTISLYIYLFYMYTQLATFTKVKQRRPRLVLEWVTVKEDRATCVRSSVWT